MSTEIKIPRGFMVHAGAKPETEVKLVVIDEGTLVCHYDDGAVSILASGSWSRIAIMPDPNYVPPTPPAPVVPEPVEVEDRSIEPAEGWLTDEQAATYNEIVSKYEGEPSDLWLALFNHDLPIEMVWASKDGSQGEDEVWAVIERLARRIRPVDPPTDHKLLDVAEDDDAVNRYL